MADYCTFWPDRAFGFDWSHCCLAHDVAYGLPNFSRWQADIDLAVCVAHETNLIVLAGVMFLGVRIFGWALKTRGRT